MFTNNSYPELTYSNSKFYPKLVRAVLKMSPRTDRDLTDLIVKKRSINQQKTRTLLRINASKRINGSFHGSARKNIFQRFYPVQNPRPLFLLYTVIGKSTKILRISFSRANTGRVWVLPCLQIYIKDCLRGAISAATLVALSTELLTKDWCFHFTFNGTHFHSWIARKLRLDTPSYPPTVGCCPPPRVPR